MPQQQTQTSLDAAQRMVTGLATLARDVNAEARRERYRFGHLSRPELVLLLEMLKSVGATQDDEVLLALVEHKAARERASARYRRTRRSEEREGTGG